MFMRTCVIELHFSLHFPPADLRLSFLYIGMKREESLGGQCRERLEGKDSGLRDMYGTIHI